MFPLPGRPAGGRRLALVLLLLPATAYDRENAILTAALAAPAVVAVAVDAWLRRAPRRPAGRARRRRAAER